jgi:uridine kinase
MKNQTKRLIISIDGPCASGKTTLARKLSEALRAPVIHTDDFVIPHARKTAERLARPGGNCDAERLVSEVLAPFQKGEPVKYRRYDCRADRLLPEEEIPEETHILIVEGSYCNLPVLRAYADVCLFVEAPEEIRSQRLQSRETPESLRRFQEKWIPLENAYFSAYGLPDGNCVLVRSP